MNAIGRSAVIVVLATFLAAPALGEEALPHEPERRPDAAIAAAVGNVVFLPVRLGASAVGGFLGGFTGFMTAGNYEAADDVWDLFRGQNILTPEIVEGQEPLRLGYLEFSAAGPPK